MPSALTAFSNSCATASGNRSLRASTATRLMSLFLAATSLAIGTETVSLPVSVEKMYLKPWSKISAEEADGASIGIWYFSEIALAALVAPEPNGANRKLTLSSVIIRSAVCTARGVFDA